MEFLAARGSEEIDDWSVSLEQDAIGTQETVKETRLERKRRFALAANVPDEGNGTTETASGAAIQESNAAHRRTAASER